MVEVAAAVAVGKVEPAAVGIGNCCKDFGFGAAVAFAEVAPLTDRKRWTAVVVAAESAG